jgi:exodeoxyribonuclease V alpha subunit
MQIENDYDKEVYNDDIGYIDDVDPNPGEIVASFDGRPATDRFGESDMLMPAYAATIYKSQRSDSVSDAEVIFNERNHRHRAIQASRHVGV